MKGFRHWWARRFGPPDQADHLALGEWGERQAEKELKRNGCRILGRRVRIGRHDELDLVIRDGICLVFVEVKTRRGEDYGRPAAAVNRDKQRKLCRAAAGYLKRLKTKPDVFRFDVVEVVIDPDEPKAKPIIRHLKNVFQMGSRYKTMW